MPTKRESLISEVQQVKKKIGRGNIINVFKVLGLFIIAGLATWQTLVFIQPSGPKKSDDHIAVIKINGAIASGSKYGDGLQLAEALKEAIDNDSAKAVVIMANSPGGSPVQSEILSEMLIREQDAAGKPIVFQIEEVCASACVYISSSLKNGMVYAHKNSLIGSIGVKMESFGLVDAMKTLGIERRSYTIGESKSFVDPFQPEDDAITQHIETELLTPLYAEFTNVVRQGRGEKLSDDPRVLTGLVWTGEQSVELGLVDEIRTSYEVREALSAEFDTDKFIVYNEGTGSIMQFLTSEFWSDVISRALIQSELRVEF